MPLSKALMSACVDQLKPPLKFWAPALGSLPRISLHPLCRYRAVENLIWSLSALCGWPLVQSSFLLKLDQIVMLTHCCRAARCLRHQCSVWHVDMSRWRSTVVLCTQRKLWMWCHHIDPYYNCQYHYFPPNRWSTENWIEVLITEKLIKTKGANIPVFSESRIKYLRDLGLMLGQIVRDIIVFYGYYCLITSMIDQLS